MQTLDSQKIVESFFKALQYLIDTKVIRGKQTFTNRYNINRWNFNSLQKNMKRDIFQVAWLTYLVNDFGVSAQRLLTGRGKMFSLPEK